MADTEEKKVSFWNGLKAEFRKIIWPDQSTVAKQTVAVIIISLIVGIIIAILDWLFQLGLGAIIK